MFRVHNVHIRLSEQTIILTRTHTDTNSVSSHFVLTCAIERDGEREFDEIEIADRRRRRREWEPKKFHAS